MPTPYLVLVDLTEDDFATTPEDLDGDRWPTTIMADSTVEAAQSVMNYLVEEHEFDEDTYELTVIDLDSKLVTRFSATRAGYSVHKKE